MAAAAEKQSHKYNAQKLIFLCQMISQYSVLMIQVKVITLTYYKLLPEQLKKMFASSLVQNSSY